MRVLKFHSVGDWGGGASVSELLARHGGMQAVKNVDEADIIVFNGGEDIGTVIYNEQPVMRGIPYNMSPRDTEEIAIFDKYKDDETKFFLGICRGSQLLNCLNGGTLFQHVNNHGRNHNMIDLQTKEIIRITSTHHQMMRPAPDGQRVCVANEATLKVADGVNNEDIELAPHLMLGDDTEVVWYPKHRALCIQGHPEYVPGPGLLSTVSTLLTLNSKRVLNMQPKGRAITYEMGDVVIISCGDKLRISLEQTNEVINLNIDQLEDLCSLGDIILKMKYST